MRIAGFSRTSSVIAVCGLSLCACASTDGLLSSNPGQIALCDAAPSLTVCAEEYAGLGRPDAFSAIQQEFQRFVDEDPEQSAAFAIAATRNLVIFNGEMSPLPEEYVWLRESAFATIGSMSVEDAEQFLAMLTFGEAAVEAGDLDGVRRAAEKIRSLIDARPEGEDWTYFPTDLGIPFPPERTLEILAELQAQLGDLPAARRTLAEANAGEDLTASTYRLKSARLEMVGGNYPEAERIAAAILDGLHHCEDAKGPPSLPTIEEQALVIIIRSTAVSDQDFSAELARLRQSIVATRSEGDAAAFKLGMLIGQLSEDAPAAATSLLAEFESLAGATVEFQRQGACARLKDRTCLLDLARQEEEAARSRDGEELFETAGYSYALAGDLDAVFRLRDELRRVDDTKSGQEEYRPDVYRQFLYQTLASVLAEDGRADDLQRLLSDRLQYQVSAEPNWQMWYGTGGNDWATFSFYHAALAELLVDAGQAGQAASNAQIALLLAYEARNTWQLDVAEFRPESLGSANGAALGALIRLDRAD